MALSHARSKRKSSGGRYKKTTKKLKSRGNLPIYTTVGSFRKISVRIRGGNSKERVLVGESANLYDPKEKKHYKSKIESVIESPSNPNFVRRNIITRGSIIKTEKGNARVTSRPGQEGTINAVLIHKN